LKIEKQLRRPSAIAHRGASGIAYENSPSAFRLAKQLGADGVELDVHATADGDLVVHHDYAIPEAGLISGLSSTDIAHHRLPNGEEIPTLGQALDLLDGLDVWVEVKSLPASFDHRLFETLDRGPTPKRYAVHGFDHRIIARLGKQRPSLSRGVLLASYLLDPVAVNFLSRNPFTPANQPGTPTASGPNENLVLNTIKHVRRTRWDGKIDHQFTSSHRVFARYSQARHRAWKGDYQAQFAWR